MRVPSTEINFVCYWIEFDDGIYRVLLKVAGDCICRYFLKLLESMPSRRSDPLSWHLSRIYGISDHKSCELTHNFIMQLYLELPGNYFAGREQPKENHKHAKPKQSAVIYDICMSSCIFIWGCFTTFGWDNGFCQLCIASWPVRVQVLRQWSRGGSGSEGGAKCRMPNKRGPEINSRQANKNKTTKKIEEEAEK